MTEVQGEAGAASLVEAHQTALRAVGHARDVFSAWRATGLAVAAKGQRGDTVTSLDRDSEQLMIQAIKESFPEHRIISEECGEISGLREWTWLIDPLDGTNNVVLGLPLFGCCAALCYQDRPVVAAIYVGHEDATYSAIAGQGAFRNGAPLRLRHAGSPEHATVSLLHGYAVGPDDPLANRLFGLLRRRFKRTLSLWAPAVDWSLLVSGRTGAVIAYRNEQEDLLCGALIAAEAGAVITDLTGTPVMDLSGVRSLVAAAPEVAPYLAAIWPEMS